MKKRVVVALGHRALGTTLPEQLEAVKKSAKVIADLIQNGYQVAITHSNAPQVGMIHTALNEFAKQHEDYTAAPMCICSAMSQGYIGYDLQNNIREELLDRGISAQSVPFLPVLLWILMMRHSIHQPKFSAVI